MENNHDAVSIQRVTKFIHRETWFSGVVSIKHSGETLFEHAAGYADRSTKINNNLQTRFGIASGTKFFTALAIGKLISANKLELSTKLKDCLDLEFHHYSPEITIQHLLTHTSGVPDYYDEEKITDFDNFTVSRPWYELRRLTDYLAVFPDEPMKFTPGARFSYSNGGYILLGLVVEQITGQRFQDYVDKQIFNAIGAHRSGYFAFDRLPENTANGYIDEKGGWRTNIYTLPVIGAADGGVFTTLGDMDIVWKAFFGNAILPKELVDIFTTPFVKAETEGEHLYYGHGLWINETPAKPRQIYITGCDAGVSFWAGVIRDTDTQVTVISNSTDDAWPLLRDIRRLLKKHPMTGT